MTNTFGDSRSTSSPPTGAGTEFERSIARSIEGDEAAPAGLREKIGEDYDTLKQSAEDAAHKATEKATEMAEKQKGYAADQISKFATTLERVGRELQSENAGAIGDYTTQLGTSARQFAEKAKDKNLGEIAGMVEDFGRRQPMAFLGIAAVAGLAASRFLMASPNRMTSHAPSTAMQNTNPTESYNG